jgi:hypothetical protein
MSLLKIHARKFLAYSTEELWTLLEGSFLLEFDDGKVIETNEKEILISSYMWEYHRKYTQTPLLFEHHIKSVIGNDRLGSNSHLKLIGNVLWTVFDIYKFTCEDKVQLLDDLAKQAYDIVNHLYNELTYRLEEYVTSMDILDFIEVAMHPNVVTAMNELEPTSESISGVYSIVTNLIKDESNFPNNALAKATKSSIVDLSQVLQCVGAIGFVNDIDSDRFKTPIRRGYVHGITSLYDSMIESRKCAMSLAFSADNLQKSEYFSRRQQLVCQNLRNVHRTDCGSTHYLLWPVRDNKNNPNPDDLITLAGKYYLDEESNTLKIVQTKDTHLYGKTLKLRSAVAGCMHPDPYGICEVCFGETSLAIPKETNIGHAACVSLTEKISQLILSTKHILGSSTIEGIVLKPFEKKYLSAPINGNVYFLNEDLKNKNIQMVIDAKSAMGLPDINLVSNVETLSVHRVSEFSEFKIKITDQKCTETIPLNVNINNRMASLSHPLLKHIKENGWTVATDNTYIVDMKGWDYKQPILTLPMKHFNMAMHQSEIASMLESTVNELTYRDSIVSPSNMLIEFTDLVNKRLSINLAILEAVIYSSMVVSAIEGDYSLPKPWTSSGMGIMRMLLNNRSMSAAMAYEKHKVSILSPSSYINIERPSHSFDSLLMPAEVLG